MSLDELTAGVRYHYENSMNAVSYTHLAGAGSGAYRGGVGALRFREP